MQLRISKRYMIHILIGTSDNRGCEYGSEYDICAVGYPRINFKNKKQLETKCSLYYVSPHPKGCIWFDTLLL